MSYAERVDENQGEIVRALERIGATVTVMRRPVDLLVGFQGRTLAIEVKVPKGKLTKFQMLWFADWRGEAHIVRSVEEAIRVVTQR